MRQRGQRTLTSPVSALPLRAGFLTGCRGSLHFRAGGGEAGDRRETNSPAPALKGHAHGSLDRPDPYRRRYSWNGTNSFAGRRALLGLAQDENEGSWSMAVI